MTFDRNYWNSWHNVKHPFWQGSWLSDILTQLRNYQPRVPKITKTPLPGTFDLVFASIKKIYKTQKTVFDYISKHLEVRQKIFRCTCIFNSLLGVWKCGQTRSFMFDLPHQQLRKRLIAFEKFHSKHLCYHTVHIIKAAQT